MDACEEEVGDRDPFVPAGQFLDQPSMFDLTCIPIKKRLAEKAIDGPENSRPNLRQMSAIAPVNNQLPQKVGMTLCPNLLFLTSPLSGTNSCIGRVFSTRCRQSLNDSAQVTASNTRHPRPLTVVDEERKRVLMDPWIYAMKRCREGPELAAMNGSSIEQTSVVELTYSRELSIYQTNLNQLDICQS